MKSWLTMMPLALALGGSVLAQEPRPPQPPEAPYGSPITLAQAKVIIAAAEAAAVKAGSDAAVIAIVQPEGLLVAFERMDGASYNSLNFAQEKAKTAAFGRRPSGDPPGAAPGPAIPGLFPLPGGIPIVYNGKTIGAIGVSGVHGKATMDDTAIAKAGLAALK